MLPATIHPSLEQEMRRVKDLQDPDRWIPVLIELRKRAELPAGGNLRQLEEGVLPQQAGLLAYLSAVGAKSVRHAVLANAISAHLKPSEIAEIARRDDVRSIRRDREEQVTT